MDDDPGEAEFSHPRNVETLRLLHTDARSVLDHQLAILGDIDDKAARTVRLTVLVLAAVISAPSVIDNPDQYVNQYTVWGGLSLVLSVVLGVITYSSSSPELGPGPSDIERVLDRRFIELEWLVIVLDNYEDWIDRTGRVNRVNGWLLALTQAALAVGLGLFVIGVAQTLTDISRYVSYPPPEAAYPVIGVVSISAFLAIWLVLTALWKGAFNREGRR
ncbi:hypothetical protein [Halobaculum magnesiiphilum]|uniref:Uncharacterized protein n=1 Tax=Halobaculum magnesiiphilum TaxID=1017351 RepID=A0A8T8W8Z0_9EURY|nr:hypothetical protein [Halobaculum magnesiiphilum]QZP36300.1 hypothetical protein K6T50_08080 [Halobaculum magnesiiphilum]